MSEATPQSRWLTLLRPRWLGWHLFAAAAVTGMLWLGDWQFRRAVAGNALSWAYTFEWPIFAIFGVVFWVKTIRDELHPPASQAASPSEITLPAGAATGSAGPVTVGGSPAEAIGQDDAGTGASQAAGPEDTELAEYNAYLAKLASQVKGHGRWHGLR
jgi:hypothetical protein